MFVNELQNENTSVVQQIRSLENKHDIISSLHKCNMSKMFFSRHAATDLVQLLIVGDGQQDVSWCDATLLVVSGCIACQLQDLRYMGQKKKKKKKISEEFINKYHRARVVYKTSSCLWVVLSKLN